MATTSITPCRDGLGSTGLPYATKQDAPHDDAMPEINKRVLALSTLNCSKLNFSRQMAAIWTAKRTKDHDEIELYRVRQSFSHEELDPKNPEDWQKCNDIGMALAKKLFPNRLVVVATQADGKGHMLHNHIEVCSQEPHGFKSLRGENKQQGTIAFASDKICEEFGLKRPANLPKTSANQRNTRSAVKVDKLAQEHDKRGKTASFLEEIQERLTKVLKNPNVIDFKSYESAAADAGINVHIRRNKRKNNNKINGLSYLLTDAKKGQKRAIKAGRLGLKFQAAMLEDHFELYKLRKLREQRRRQRLLAAESAAENTNTKQPSISNVSAKPKNNLNKKNKTEKDNQNENDEPTF